ncbi:MAG: hypothetical protein QF926_08490 [Alphaproteobacteria bacterium]|jgi:hypothetical protein|nr:hypothetical protein [Alphaproteobacteria bacterium]MDP6516644.1 hypothetical protein [Alphaproteobacteria bacterium]|tara:strand:+ start:396 stop:560 length:165 start_codon:yes stop_codon:yes gene_type:complete
MLNSITSDRNPIWGSPKAGLGLAVEQTLDHPRTPPMAPAWPHTAVRPDFGHAGI